MCGVPSSSLCLILYAGRDPTEGVPWCTRRVREHSALSPTGSGHRRKFPHESTQMLHRWYLTTVLSFPRDVIHHLVGRKGKRQLGQSA